MACLVFDMRSLFLVDGPRGIAMPSRERDEGQILFLIVIPIDSMGHSRRWWILYS